jgi:hypothetical protein
VQVLDPSLTTALQESGLAARLAGLVLEQAKQPTLLRLLTLPPGFESEGHQLGAPRGADRGPRTRDHMTTGGDTLGLVVGEAVQGTSAVIQFKIPAHEGEGPRPPLLVGLVGVEAPPGGDPTVAFTVLLTGGGTLVVRVRSADSSATMRMAPFGSGVARRLFHLEMVGSEPWLEVSS